MKAPDAFRTISEVAEDLDLPQHVLRFWETRFNQIKPMKRGGGRRYYRPEDIDLLRGIRILLYAEGFTIRGVQRLLKENGVPFVAAVGQTGSVQTVGAVAREDEAAREVSPDFDATVAFDEDVFAFPTEQVSGPARAVSEQNAAERVTVGPAPVPAQGEPATSALALTAEARSRLQTALADLEEAKRLLDQAR